MEEALGLLEGPADDGTPLLRVDDHRPVSSTATAARRAAHVLRGDPAHSSAASTPRRARLRPRQPAPWSRARRATTSRARGPGPRPGAPPRARRPQGTAVDAQRPGQPGPLARAVRARAANGSRRRSRCGASSATAAAIAHDARATSACSPARAGDVDERRASSSARRWHLRARPTTGPGRTGMQLNLGNLALEAGERRPCAADPRGGRASLVAAQMLCAGGAGRRCALADALIAAGADERERASCSTRRARELRALGDARGLARSTRWRRGWSRPRAPLRRAGRR